MSSNNAHTQNQEYHQQQQQQQQPTNAHLYPGAYPHYIGMSFPPRPATGYVNPYVVNPHLHHPSHFSSPVHAPAPHHSPHNPFETNSMTMNQYPNSNLNQYKNSSNELYASDKRQKQGQDQNQAEINPISLEPASYPFSHSGGNEEPLPVESGSTTDDFFDLSDTFFSLDGLLDEFQRDSLLPSTDSNVLSSDIQNYLNRCPISGNVNSPSPSVSQPGSSLNHTKSSFSAPEENHHHQNSFSQNHHYQRLAQNKPAPLKIPPRQVSKLKDEEYGELGSPLKRSRRSLEEIPTSSPLSTPPRTSSLSNIDSIEKDEEEKRTKKRRRVNTSQAQLDVDSPEVNQSSNSPRPSSEKSESVSSPESIGDETCDSQKNKSSLMCLGRVKRKRLPKVYDSMVLRFQCM